MRAPRAAYVGVMSQEPVPPPHALSTVRARRVRLRRSSQELEAALAAPLVQRPAEWLARIVPATAAVREAFGAHISITEARDGLFDQVRGDAPRLDPLLRRLIREHTEIADRLDGAELVLHEAVLHEAVAGEQATSHSAKSEAARSEPPEREAGESDLDRVREHLTETLAALSRHRQRGSDLLYQAYHVDLGGE